MTASLWTDTSELSSAADTALKAAAVLWFLVAFAMAGGLSVLTVAMGFAMFMAAAVLWLPRM